MRHDRARHDGPEQFPAGRVLQGFHAAAQRVDQAVARGFVGQVALDLVIQHIVDDIGQRRIPGGALVEGMVAWLILLLL